MTSAVPGFISWPVLICFVLVLAFRLRWLGTGFAARHRNRVLIFVAATQLTAEPAVQHLLAVSIPCPEASLSQIPFALLLLISPELIGFLAMIDGTDEALLARAYRQYRVATFATIAILGMIATGPRIHHQPIALAGDNSEIYAALVWSVLSITAAATIFRLVAQVLRRPRHSAAQRVIIGELIALGIATCLPGLTIFTLALLQRLDLVHTLAVRQIIYSHASFGALLAALPLALGPCFVAAQALLHRDTNGRTWRKLQPLWTDLTTAYPDTILNPPPQRFQPVTDFQLHRIIIEIRDALLQLAPYITALTGTDRQQLARARGSSTDADSSALHALQIAKAIARPTVINTEPARSAALPATATREGELTQLMELAGWWPTVKRFAVEGSAGVTAPLA
ncbi:putative membrane protein [Mycobacteroides abscessus 5S-0422]|uniref:Putative membrane protein n=1 Tax=Mycobacteroides abscessus subsp. bolletii 1513 TaxID=1299321 RepID=X8DIA0_9MYCO|nr:MAB_1171c family putative transporter [Mycobacteroides abscessus]EUA67463.1 putative membrane protein [Mycobacteroides abscessus subsp. bolletii 1513]EIU07814.1 putative membrane protein [Mycobacteroides abscessus 5S-0421]EIU09806.1 putative membrane protein [Mycobacteroides abscessus 5S-0304]EIU19561.1 putative membrane protein [Mycobacteroides abscessus 5S-0422]EIU20698.1 putative membrane protein [Mycobacteroides abscessus 5S-0708]